jgi:hypothetical protein
MENNNKQSLSQNENLQTAFRELCNNTNAIKNTIYWLDKYLETNENDKNTILKICKLKVLLEVANRNVDYVFDELNMIMEN